MGEVINFPIDDGPRPFRPDTAVRQYLREEKSDAVISFRIPGEIKAALMEESFVSNDQFSRHIASIVCAHLSRQGLHCVRMAGVKREEQKAKAA